MLPLDTSCQAQYEDGFILDETALGDIYQDLITNEDGTQVYKNVFYAILEKLPEAEHGKMTRFTVFYKDKQYDFDWTQLPESARPIRFRHGASYLGVDGASQSEWTGMQIGYQYNDENGKNIQVVEDIA